jgi:hypothetical protein
MFKDNPEFVVAYQGHDITLYMPAEITAYHKSRELAMQVQDAYSRCGISKETLTEFANKLVEFANKTLNQDTLRTDVGLIGNNLLARMKSPIDELCAIRMGAIACFEEGENPNEVKEIFTQHKMRLAERHADIYDFFFHTGIAFTQEYSSLWRGLQAQDYLQHRKMLLDTMTPTFTPKTT